MIVSPLQESTAKISTDGAYLTALAGSSYCFTWHLITIAFTAASILPITVMIEGSTKSEALLTVTAMQATLLH
jgi:hypothetical protein